MGTRRRKSPAPRETRNTPVVPRPPSTAAAKPQGPARALERLHARRLRACASLDIPVPPEARDGAPATLLRRIALLDRRIEVSLDLAGGRRFAPWDEEPDEEVRDEESPPEWRS